MFLLYILGFIVYFFNKWVYNEKKLYEKFLINSVIFKKWKDFVIFIYYFGYYLKFCNWYIELNKFVIFIEDFW